MYTGILRVQNIKETSGWDLIKRAAQEGCGHFQTILIFIEEELCYNINIE